MAKREQRAISPHQPTSEVASSDQSGGSVFISWSGEISKQIAEGLKIWLPEVIEGIEPWISTHDISPGLRWGTEIQFQLNHSNFGIICLTEENLEAPWILFEAGALSKTIESARVVPYLFQVSGSEVKPPLGQFNYVAADKKGTLDLLRGINAQFGQKYEESRLERKFEKYWPDLAKMLASIPRGSGGHHFRRDRELIEELLDLARRQFRPDDVLKEFSNQVDRLATIVNDSRHAAFFNTGYELVDYLGLLPSAYASSMGDGTLYAYWQSLVSHIKHREDAGDVYDEELEQFRYTEEDYRDEVKKRVIAKMQQSRWSF